MLVSVIMPAFNAEKYIAQSIQSVLSQTYREFEIIVVDDGSTDRTAEVVRGLAAADERIRLVSQPNGRLGRARNNGIAHSRGALIAFLDSDDLWLEHKLELQVEALRSHGADLVYSNGYVFHGEETADESTEFNTPEGHMRFGKIDGDEMFRFLFPVNRIPVLSVVLRRELWERAGGFEEAEPFHGVEDYDLWLRFAARGAVFYGIREPLVRYRVHPGAMSQKAANMTRATVAVFERRRHATGVEAAVRRARLRSLYRQTVEVLIEGGMVAEARKYLLRQAWRERLAPRPLVEALLVGALPRRHSAIYGLLDRVTASASYRLGWPVKSPVL